jgi:hypothetical protein
MTYGLGRGLERADRSVVDDIARTVAQNDHRFMTVVTGIVQSRPFRMRARGE